MQQPTYCRLRVLSIVLLLAMSYNAPCHKALISNWCQEPDKDFTAIQFFHSQPDLNPTEHIWNEVEEIFTDVQMTNLQQLCDAFTVNLDQNLSVSNTLLKVYGKELRPF